jgi:hypothetical protein
MARTTVTESDLGLEVTEEEMAAPAVSHDDNDDDISLHDDVVDEPAKAAAAEPAKDDAGKPAEPAKQEEPKTVDVRALQEARAEAREAKQRATILEQRWNDFLAGSQQQAKPAAPEAPAIPKFGADPIAAGEWTQDQIIALLDAQRAEREQTATQQREEQEFQAVAQTVMQDYQATKQADPSIDDAYSALRKSQGEEMLAMGYSIPEAKAELDRLEREHIKFVAARGLPIGNYIKALASARGWQPGAAVPAPQVKTDLKAVAETQQRHQSLSDAPGGEAIPPLDAKALARMSDKDFKAWMSKKGNEAKFDEIMGR